MKKIKPFLLILSMTFVLAGCYKQGNSFNSNSIVESNPKPVVSENVADTDSLTDEPELPIEETEKEGIIQPGTYEKVLNADNYRKDTNWDEIEKAFAELKIKYTIQALDDSPFVTELYFIGTSKDGVINELGSFTKTGGFLDSKYEEFIHDPYLKKEADFFRNSLLGLSVEAIDYPFSLNGVALTTDSEIYETECLCRLSINCDQKTIEEWFPEL